MWPDSFNDKKYEQKLEGVCAFVRCSTTDEIDIDPRLQAAYASNVSFGGNRKSASFLRQTGFVQPDRPAAGKTGTAEGARELEGK